MIGANLTDYEAQKLYSDNGNKIDKFSVKWDDPILKIKWPIKNPILSNRDRLGYFVDKP